MQSSWQLKWIIVSHLKAEVAADGNDVLTKIVLGYHSVVEHLACTVSQVQFPALEDARN